MKIEFNEEDFEDYRQCMARSEYEPDCFASSELEMFCQNIDRLIKENYDSISELNSVDLSSDLFCLEFEWAFGNEFYKATVEVTNVSDDSEKFFCVIPLLELERKLNDSEMQEWDEKRNRWAANSLIFYGYERKKEKVLLGKSKIFEAQKEKGLSESEFLNALKWVCSGGIRDPYQFSIAKRAVLLRNGKAELIEIERQADFEEKYRYAGTYEWLDLSECYGEKIFAETEI